MEPIQVDLTSADNSFQEFDFTGKDFIHRLISDDFGAPPRVLRIHATTSDGKKVCVRIPYDNTSGAYATVDGE